MYKIMELNQYDISVNSVIIALLNEYFSIWIE